MFRTGIGTPLRCITYLENLEFCSDDDLIKCFQDFQPFRGFGILRYSHHAAVHLTSEAETLDT